MPSFTTPVPPKLKGDTTADIETIRRWGISLIDELTYLFNNLDTQNVIEAQKVKAENIDVTNAKIGNAQVGALSADKLAAGSVDTSKVSVKDETGRLNITGSKITISDKMKERFVAAYDKFRDMFTFVLYNKDGKPTVSIDSVGDAHFGGVVEGSAIYSSTIIGTTSELYESNDGGVFAHINPKGIRVMQDIDGKRQQKIGMSVADDGTAYLIMGAGDGGGKVRINGAEYTNGAFNIEKNEAFTSMGIVGGRAKAFFYDNGDLNLCGNKVMINGENIDDTILNLSRRIDNLEKSLANTKSN